MEKGFRRTLKKEGKDQLVDTVETFLPEVPYAARTVKRGRKIYDSR